MANILPSKKQELLLEFIDAFIKENNFAPSYREVMRALDYKSVSTVAKHIDGLIERGWLVKRDNEKRSLEVAYKVGQGQSEMQKSPAPSVFPAAADHEAWLRTRIAERLADSTQPLSDDDRAAIFRTLAILGLDVAPESQGEGDGQTAGQA